MRNSPRTTRTGFTLIELTIVISVIVLAMAISLPTLITSFRAGADKQAENMFSSLCTAARVTAIRDGKYILVHHQLSVPNPSGGGDAARYSYVAICTRDPITKKFRLTQGFDPQRLPGDMCLGAVSTATVTAGTGNYSQPDVDNIEKFTCFSIVFSPAGRVVSQIDGFDPISFDIADPAFVNDPNRLWDPGVANGNNTTGISAVNLFSYGQYLARPTGAGAGSRFAYINENADFLPVNVYTGQLFPRK